VIEPAEHAEPDAVAGVPHPRHTRAMYGQEVPESELLTAIRTQRLHHAWLITGPRGVGKATFAWRIARWLLTAQGRSLPEAATLGVDQESAVARRIDALSEPALFLLRRAWDERGGRLMTVITVDEVRRLGSFFALSRPDGGRRVVIVDAADDMNINAANALLKILEEPPRDTTMLLVCHRPGALLPTIRSRCRTLRCGPLSARDLGLALDAAGVEAGDDATLLAELAGGSVGEAARLAQVGGAKIYREVAGLMGSMPLLDRAAALSLAERCAGRGNEARLDATLGMFDAAISRLALRAAGAAMPEAVAGEAEIAARLAPTAGSAKVWADLQSQLAARAGHGRAVNLDPASLILDMVLKANETAARTVGQAP
jgi:DNA polymerase-3 subunit delta'